MNPSDRNKRIAEAVGCSPTNQKKIAEVVKLVPLSIRENKSINRSQRDDEIIKWLELNYVKSIEVNIPHKPKK
ncbi:MAG: hypothetical protein WBI40_13025, partial [Methylococcaceae bacterium]